jgi:flagellar hook-associated protein 1 FlgK
VTLSSAGAIALRSLGVISDQTSVTSRNISGAGVAGVSAKVARLSSDEYGADFQGVGRAADAALFRNLLTATAQRGAARAVSGALSRLDLALGLSESSSSRSPSAVLTKLRTSLQAASAAPQDLTAAQTAVSAAQNVVAALHDAAKATQDERQGADAAI